MSIEYIEFSERKNSHISHLTKEDTKVYLKSFDLRKSCLKR
jgi:hypothetical protein